MNEQSLTPQAGGADTILVAEDEPLVRDLAVRMLRCAGYRVIAARDGEEAMRLWDENRDRISAAVLDMVMPKAPGRETYDRIRSVSPNLGVVFITGYRPEGMESALVSNGRLKLIEKPFDEETLLSAVQSVID